ncbi:hypothetical protein [Microvirga sp. VF16]|uniref:hypothetical protein n=1 Tax=Microvirga sp. VF16 TaxID=2807101 RepID=UPI00193DEBD6|nr:hypothetical protein [Microvirga sp. VF16]QRM30523.1 hypothetical protein JO965_05840 [Microvirga sp. VF16]
MKNAVLVLACAIASLFATSHPQAATQQECLKAIELTKRFEQEGRKAHAVYQQEKTEISRCEFLSKSRKHLAQAEKTTDMCQVYEPELAGKLKADVVAGLKMLDSPNNTCNSKSRADLLAEKRCMDAQKSASAKNEVFQTTLATYNGNKNNQTQCTFLKASLEYFTDGEKMLRTCEPILEPGKPSKVPENRESIQKIRATQAKFCK